MSVPYRDPETGEEWVRGPSGQLRRPCPPDCSHGLRPVTEVYAIAIADPDVEPLKYQAALNSVYPCSTCRPEQARLWAEGHTSPKHLSEGGCEECRPRKGKGR